MRCLVSILFLVSVLSCSKGDKYASQHSLPLQGDKEASGNFHQNQAKEIIDGNIENKAKNRRHAEKRRQEHAESLEELNKTNSDEKKTFQKRPDYLFY
jgi:hypothetical protein